MARRRDAYESYEGFLRAAIKEYWDSGRASRVNFLALLLASREAWSVAWEAAAGGGKRIVAGAAGAATLALLLRVVVGGPIGLILGGATIASLVALYVRNHREIWAKADHFRGLLDRYRAQFDRIRDDYLDGELRTDQRDLMMDGLLSRMLDELDEYDPDLESRSDSEEDDDVAELRESEFARHASRRRAQEEREREGDGG